VFSVHGWCRKLITDMENHLPDLSSEGTAVWPEELEDLVCDVTCTIVQ
jgi:hypothetical protein